MVMEQTSLQSKKKVDVSSTFIENIFQSGLTLVSSNDNNHKKINKQKRFKNNNLAVKWTKGKRTKIMRWKKR